MAAFGTSGEATTLTADLGINDKTMAVASATGFPPIGTIANPGWLCRIDKEWLLVVRQPVALTMELGMRGVDGTVARAHDTLSKVEVSALAADFAGPSPGNNVTLPPYIPAMETIGEDRTFTSAEVLAWGNQPRNFAITKGSAAAIVLVAPSKGQDGLVVTFTSLSAYLHVITATTLLASGGTASPYTTATGPHTKVGATIVLQAQNGLWNIVASSFTIS